MTVGLPFQNNQQEPQKNRKTLKQRQQYHDQILETSSEGTSANSQATSKIAFNSKRDRCRRHRMDTRRQTIERYLAGR